jgi:hypothetical protein
MRQHPVIVFPAIAASLGGAQRVEYSARFAWITRANGVRVRVPLTQLPPQQAWTSFNLGDAAAAIRARFGAPARIGATVRGTIRAARRAS